MRTLRTVFAVVGALTLVSACASTDSGSWTKAGATQEEMGRDRTECLLEARRVTPAGGRNPTMTLDYPRYERCMEDRGYTTTTAQ